MPTRSRVVLVLHQSEARKSSNTGRLAVRCLPNSLVVAHGRLPDSAGEGRLLVTGPPYPWQDGQGAPVLLFPDENARPIEEWRASHEAVTLIALDGTWAQAARARRRLPGLLDLASASVPTGPPLHRIRDDPRPGRLGTLEALGRALGVLEGGHVQAQLEAILAKAAQRLRHGRLGQTPGLPPQYR